MKEKIVQIIPAVGWRALFASEPEVPGLDEPWILFDVVCFALVEDKDGDTRVCGQISADIPTWIDGVEDDNNFIAYIGPSENPETFRKYCLEYLAKKNK